MPGAAGEPAIAAVVDVGSNSVLLLVVAVAADGRAIVRDEALATTQLGRGLVEGGALDPQAITRTSDAVTAMVDRARGAGSTHVWAYATGAARRARDGAEFASALADRVGCPVEVLTGEREARLAHAAASLAVEAHAALMVVDVGGGTTELTRGCGARVDDVVSLPLGALALIERHGNDRQAMAAAIDATLASTDVAARAAGATVVVSGGTASALATLDLGLDGYDPSRIHRHVLDVASLARLATCAGTATLDPGRARLLPAGALVLSRIATAAGARTLMVSELAVRHAYLVERLGRAVDLRAPWG